MANNRKRWDWLCETYRDLDDPTRHRIIEDFIVLQKEDRDDVALQKTMTNLGIIIKGQDPDPPPPVYVTDAGAEEYEEIMQCILIERP